MSSANNSVYNSTKASKRNINQRRVYVPHPPKVLTTANNHNISNNREVTQQNTSISSVNAGTPLRGKDFVIKQKAKREYTSENEKC